MTISFQMINQEIDRVNQIITEKLPTDVPFLREIGNHIINSGGKRLRPILVLLVALSQGYKGDKHTVLAAAIELIHTASLLHDDVIDQSSLRRGRPTAQAIWGNTATILTGDFIYSNTFNMLTMLDDMDIMAEISNATRIVSEGELLQLSYVGKADMHEDDYLQIIFKKNSGHLSSSHPHCRYIGSERKNT